MAESTKTHTLKKAMIEAMNEKLGVAKQSAELVAETVGMKSTTLLRRHFEWMNDDDEYAKQVNDVDDIVIDFAKNALYDNIKDGDTTSIIFLLKTKGAKAGFVEQRNYDIQSGGKPISISPINWTDGSGKD